MLWRQKGVVGGGGGTGGGRVTCEGVGKPRGGGGEGRVWGTRGWKGRAQGERSGGGNSGRGGAGRGGIAGVRDRSMDAGPTRTGRRWKRVEVWRRGKCSVTQRGVSEEGDGPWGWEKQPGKRGGTGRS